MPPRDQFSPLAHFAAADGVGNASTVVTPGLPETAAGGRVSRGTGAVASARSKCSRSLRRFPCRSPLASGRLVSSLWLPETQRETFQEPLGGKTILSRGGKHQQGKGLWFRCWGAKGRDLQVGGVREQKRDGPWRSQKGKGFRRGRVDAVTPMLVTLVCTPGVWSQGISRAWKALRLEVCLAFHSGCAEGHAICDSWRAERGKAGPQTTRWWEGMPRGRT